MNPLHRFLSWALAAALLGSGVLKIVAGGEHYLPPLVLYGAAAAECALATILVVCRRTGVVALAIAALSAGLLMAGYLIPLPSSCGCLGGISMLERNRAWIAAVMGAAALWLWAQVRTRSGQHGIT